MAATGLGVKLVAAAGTFGGEVVEGVTLVVETVVVLVAWVLAWAP